MVVALLVAPRRLPGRHLEEAAGAPGAGHGLPAEAEGPVRVDVRGLDRRPRHAPAGRRHGGARRPWPAGAGPASTTVLEPGWRSFDATLATASLLSRLESRQPADSSPRQLVCPRRPERRRSLDTTAEMQRDLAKIYTFKNSDGSYVAAEPAAATDSGPDARAWPSSASTSTVRCATGAPARRPVVKQRWPGARTAPTSSSQRGQGATRVRPGGEPAPDGEMVSST